MPHSTSITLRPEFIKMDEPTREIAKEKPKKKKKKKKNKDYDDDWEEYIGNGG